MNGFADHGLDESAFGDKTGGFRENIRTFDAFRKNAREIPRHLFVLGHRCRPSFSGSPLNYR